MSKSVFPRTEVEDMPPQIPARTRNAPVPVPRWVIVSIVILLLLLVVMAILSFTSHGMGHMSFIEEGWPTL